MNYKKITLFLIATVILLTLVSCTNTNDKNTNKQIINSNVVETNDEYTNKQIVKSYVFNNKYGTYYTGSSLFLLDGENVVKVKSNTDSKNADSLLPYYYPGICIGETIYGPIGDIRTALYKSNFVSKDTVETTEWVTNETLLKSFISQKDTSDSSSYMRSITNLQSDGQYVYFINIPLKDFWPVYKKNAYKLGRISLDGSKIEPFGDIIASTYTLSNNSLYYYDNGYTYNKNSKNEYTIDDSRIGIYKVNLDGSNKKLIYNDFLKAAEDKRGELGATYCNKLTAINDNLYFIDYSDKGRGRIAKIKSDGSSLEYICENSANSFSLDTENNRLFYATGKYGLNQFEPSEVYQVSLDTGNEKLLFEDSMDAGRKEFYYYNNCLYGVCDAYHVNSLCGDIYNLSTKEFNKISSYPEEEQIDNSYDLFESNKSKEYYVYTK